MPLDPQVSALLAQFEGRPTLDTLPVAVGRRAYAETTAKMVPRPAGELAVDERLLPGPAGPMRARVYRPAAPGAGRPLVVYLHGGGWVVCDLDTHDALCRRLSLGADAVVVSIDYRLAPEHRFPTAADDAWAALRWLAANAGALGLGAQPPAVGGDSAGATLAAVCAIKARDAGLPLALQLLITPGTTAHQDTASHKLFAQGFLLDAAAIDWFFDHYCPHAHRRDWRFAPLEAPDLEGVAPACVVLAECDPLVDEGIAYADRLRASGVPVQLELYRGLTHDFIKMGRVLKEAGQAQQAAADALKEAWNR